MPNLALGALRYLLRLPVHAPYALADMAADALGVLDALGIAARPCLRRLDGRHDRAAHGGAARRDRVAQPDADDDDQRRAPPAAAECARAARAAGRAPDGT